MYDSGITLSQLISDVRSEADVSLAIPDSLYVRTVNAVEQFLYTEILKEYVLHSFDPADDDYDGTYSYIIADIAVPAGCDTPNYDDIVRVWADGDQIEKSSAGTAHEFPEKNLCYTDYNGNLIVQSQPFNSLNVLVRIRPALKTVGVSGAKVMVPPEFIELVASRMRGEAYKVANEDGQAAKWLAEYNAQVENFKVWAAARNDRYGV